MSGGGGCARSDGGRRSVPDSDSSSNSDSDFLRELALLTLANVGMIGLHIMHATLGERGHRLALLTGRIYDWRPTWPLGRGVRNLLKYCWYGCAGGEEFFSEGEEKTGVHATDACVAKVPGCSRR